MPTFLRRIAPLTALLIAINVALYLWQIATGISPTDPELDDLARWGANISALTLTGDSWRLLTSMFLHIGALHLLLNMVSLLFLGTVAERNFGKINFLIIYLLSGLGGSLMSAVWNARPAGESMAAMTSAAPTVYLVVSAGASGAVMGLAAASIVLKLLALARREYLPMPFSGKELAILVAINVVYGWQTNGTDNACHIGGLIAGAIVGLLLGAVRNQHATVRGLAQAVVLVAGIAGTFVVAQSNASRDDLQQIRQQLEED